MDLASQLKFGTDSKSLSYLSEIINHMTRGFDLSEDQAISHVNRAWSQIGFIGGEEELMFHEPPEYWANFFYLGNDSYWWIQGAKRNSMGLPPLKSNPIDET